MSVHSRRTIQRRLSELRGVVPDGERQELADRLNQRDKNALAAEWEVVILHALSKLGSLSYQPETGGSRRFDALLSLPNGRGEFLADITAVSDDGLSKDNPAELFEDGVHKCLDYYSTRPYHVDIQVEGKTLGEYGNAKMTLGLPKKGEIPSWVRRNLRPLGRAIRDRPGERHEFVGRDPAVRVRVTYKPSPRKTASGGHPSYTAIYSLERNPVFHRLRAKDRQFHDTGYAGCGGVFLCDAGCTVLTDPLAGITSFSMRQIVGEFFRQSNRLGFVVVISPTRRDVGALHSRIALEARVDLYVRPTLDASSTRELQQLALAIRNLLPPPLRTGSNAARKIRTSSRWSGSFLGGFEVSGNSVRLSCRVLTSLLAGHMTQEEFRKSFCDDNGANAFESVMRSSLANGRMLTFAAIEHCPDRDDDWVTLTFGEQDAAVSEFKA